MNQWVSNAEANEGMSRTHLSVVGVGPQSFNAIDKILVEEDLSDMRNCAADVGAVVEECSISLVSGDVDVICTACIMACKTKTKETKT